MCKDEDGSGMCIEHFARIDGGDRRVAAEQENVEQATHKMIQHHHNNTLGDVCLHSAHVAA